MRYIFQIFSELCLIQSNLMLVEFILNLNAIKATKNRPMLYSEHLGLVVYILLLIAKANI